jgi:hypothetical protein
VRSVDVVVQQQEDNVSCGLFTLCFACYIVQHPTWKDSISDAIFDVESMRTWLNSLRTEHRTFVLSSLPSFVLYSTDSQSLLSSTLLTKNVKLTDRVPPQEGVQVDNVTASCEESSTALSERASQL